MKAVLVNPYDKTVTDVQYSGDYNEIYRLIDADLFTIVRIGPDSEDGTLFVDDEGLLKITEETRFFAIWNSSVLAGKGLLLGSNEETGDSVDAPHNAEWYRPHIKFMGRAAAVVYAALRDGGFHG